MEILAKVLRQNKGKMPPRKQRIQLANELNMNENVIYKWFWELRYKQDQIDEAAQSVSIENFHELSDEKKFQYFVSKALD